MELSEADWAAILFQASVPASREEMLAEDDVLVSTLAQGVSCATSKTVRQLSLRCMCTLARYGEAAGHFTRPDAISAVLQLATLVPRWRDDLESGLMVCYLTSILRYMLIAADEQSWREIENLSDWLESLGGDSANVNVLALTYRSFDEVPSLLDTEGLYALGIAAFSGVDLAGLLLCLLLKYTMTPQGNLPGASASPEVVALLVSLCTESKTSVHTKVRARSLLLALAASSQSFREDLLDQMVSQATGLQPLPSLETEDLRNPLFLRPGGLLPIYGQRGSSSRGAGVSLSLASPAAHVPRDVELRARGGDKVADHTWHCTSSVLWARCPGLRDVLEQLWLDNYQGAGGALELEVDASPTSLATLVRFVHGGLFVPPITLPDHLEMFKIASDLRIPELGRMAAKSLLAREDTGMLRKEDALRSCMMYAEEHGLSILSQACQSLTRGNSNRTLAAGTTAGDAQLRTRVYQSLQDVERVTSSSSSSLSPLTQHGEEQQQLRHDIRPIPTHTPLVPTRVPVPVPVSDSSGVEAERVVTDGDESFMVYDDSSGNSGSDGAHPEAMEYVAERDSPSLGLRSRCGVPSTSERKNGGTGRKPKSGGIYSLLLKEGSGEGDDGVNGSEYGMGSYIEENWATTEAAAAAAEAEQSSKSEPDSGSLPLSPNSAGSTGFAEDDSPLDWVVAASVEAGASKGPAGTFEYMQNISLAPTPKKTEKELRLQEMSRPKSAKKVQQQPGTAGEPRRAASETHRTSRIPKVKFPAAKEYSPDDTLEGKKVEAAAIPLPARSPPRGPVDGNATTGAPTSPDDIAIKARVIKAPQSRLKLLKAKVKKNPWVAVSTPPPAAATAAGGAAVGTGGHVPSSTPSPLPIDGRVVVNAEALSPLVG